jgi:SAM-dependent methyltransferase
MAVSCPIGFDTARLRREVAEMYEAVATAPDGDYHFHRGPQYAARQLRYDEAELAGLPTIATASFAGVGNPLAIAPLAPGQTIVDVGCGAGTDLLLAARRVGPGGRAIGVDMTEAMRQRAMAAATEMDLEHVEVRAGDAESLPIEDERADVVISNGVINLTTDKSAAFSEIFRVLRPGGRLQLADIIVSSELSESVRNNIDLWTS